MKKIELSPGVFTVELEKDEPIHWHASFFHEETLTELWIPEGATAVAEKAFAYCRGLRLVHLPKSIEHLGHAIFYGTYRDIEIDYAGTAEQFRALGATRRVVRSVQVPGEYDVQPYCNTEGTYYRDETVLEYFHAFCPYCAVTCADGETVTYGKKRE